MRRAQIAIEYLIVMSFAAVLLTGYLLVALNAQQQAHRGAEDAEADRIAAIIQTELIVATQVRDGYTRTFELPQTIHGEAYVIRADGRIVSVDTGDSAAARTVPPFTGVPTPGTNTLSRNNGTVRFI